MGKFLFNVLQLIFIAWLVYKALGLILRSKKKTKKSIVGKVWQLLTNRIHYYLDNALRKQRKVLQTDKNKEVKLPSNVIPFRNTK